MDSIEVICIFRYDIVNFVRDAIDDSVEMISSALEGELEQTLSVQINTVEQEDTDLILNVIDLNVFLGSAHQNLERQDFSLC